MFLGFKNPKNLKQTVSGKTYVFQRGTIGVVRCSQLTLLLLCKAQPPLLRFVEHLSCNKSYTTSRTSGHVAMMWICRAVVQGPTVRFRWRSFSWILCSSGVEVCGKDYICSHSLPFPLNHSHSHSHDKNLFPFLFFPIPLFPIPIPITIMNFLEISKAKKSDKTGSNL